MNRKFTMQSMGCAKNLCDAEQMLAAMLSAGYEYVDDPDEADIAVVNTCAFIEDAKKESIEAILDIAGSKNTGALQALVITGCMAQRYREEILQEIPEADAVLGTANYSDIVEVCNRLLDASEKGEMQPETHFGDINGPLWEAPRVQTTPPFTAYLKIAEGCDNCCTYCVIPDLRGRYRSRREEDIIAEARHLAENGVKELIVIAQDITRYGIDLYGERRLPALLRSLAEIEGIAWIRLHYLYPSDITDELIGVIASEEKILKYIDMPIQHCCDRILGLMNRRDTRAEIEAMVKKLRKRIPGLILRTTVIVGFPGETKAEFGELCSFMERMKFDRAGVFAYSQEEGTPAAGMPDQVDEDEKKHRAETLANVQERIAAKLNAKRIGKTVTVLVEGYDRSGGCYYSRSYGESPDIDGKIFFLRGETRPEDGSFVRVRLTEDLDGDLVGELVEEEGNTDDTAE